MRTRITRPTAGALVLVIAAVLGLALAGCGGSGGPRAAVASTVQAYLHGILSGDGAEVCSHLTPQLRTEQTAAINRELGNSSSLLNAVSGKKPLSCQQAFAKISSLVPSKDRSKTIKVVQVTVTGDTATARIQGGTGTAHLVKQNGTWLLGAAPSSSGGS